MDKNRPTHMRAAVLTGFDDPKTQLVLRDLPIPELKRGEVLVRMAMSPINPSDLVFLRNLYGVQKTCPVVPGFEGSGIVVKVSTSRSVRRLLGKNVACRAPLSGNGTWAEYMAVDASGCIPLRSNVGLEQGAMLFVNPMTAWALIDLAKRERHRAIVLTAAASAIGRMIGALAHHRHLSVICIVRRPEHVELLKSRGEKYVLDSTKDGFGLQLQALAKRLSATLSFDAVGGSLTARVASALPPHSRIVVYGALSGEPCSIPPAALIFQGKSLNGFWLTEWIKSQGPLHKRGMIRNVQKLLAGPLQSTVQARLPLEKIHEAIDLYKKNRTAGKVLITL